MIPSQLVQGRPSDGCARHSWRARRLGISGTTASANVGRRRERPPLPTSPAIRVLSSSGWDKGWPMGMVRGQKPGPCLLPQCPMQRQWPTTTHELWWMGYDHVRIHHPCMHTLQAPSIDLTLWQVSQVWWQARQRLSSEDGPPAPTSKMVSDVQSTSWWWTKRSRTA